MEDDTLLPLPTPAEIAAEHAHDEVNTEQGEVAVRRNRPRHTLVNSGALRQGQQQPSSIPLPAAMPKSDSMPIATPSASAAFHKEAATRRPSLATSSLGIKARRVSELVRASTPPLPSIADFSSLETPNNHLLLDAGLPSPSPYAWRTGLRRTRLRTSPPSNTLPPLTTASTPPLWSRPNRATSFESRATRSAACPCPHRRRYAHDTKSEGSPTADAQERSAGAVAETPAGVVYEDEHDSLRKGWMYDEDEEHVDLPDFSIERTAQQQQHREQQKAKKTKAKVKPRGSMKVKPGPMARTFFR